MKCEKVASALVFFSLALLASRGSTQPSLESKKDEVRLTLEESVQIAVRAATSVLKAQNSVDSNGAVLLQSYGQFLPNLNAQANSTYNTGTQYFTTASPTLVTGSNSQVGYGLNATLNIFNGLSDFSHLKASLARKNASDLSVLRAKQAIALDVTQGFLTVILDNHLVDFALKNFQESQAREKLLTEQTRVGAKNLADLFRQQAETSADQSLLLTNENKKRNDEILLLQKLRLDVSKDYVFVDYQAPPETADSQFSDEDLLLQTGLANRADLKASDETARAAHWDVTNQRGNYFPKLNLIGSMNSGGSYLYDQNVAGVNVVPTSQSSPYSQLSSQTEYSFGIVLTWAIFDRFVTTQNYEQAHAFASNADIDAEDLKNQVRADVKLAYNNYKTAVQQLSASKKGLAAAQKAYEVIEGRYEVGSASFIDLITVQAALLQAESARAQALTDFILQSRAVQFATGEISID